MSNDFPAEHLRPRLEPWVEELGRMPFQRELKICGQHSLAKAISNLGGYQRVATLLRYRYAGPSRDRLEGLRGKLEPIIADLGRMPNRRELRSRGYGHLLSTIDKLGGLARVSLILGLEVPSRNKRWHRVEDLRGYLDPIADELGRMPTGPELMRRGLLDVKGAVSKFGGPKIVAETFGYEYESRSSWESVEDLRAPLDELIAETGRFPRFSDLVERRLFGIAWAIHRFGGFDQVASDLGYPHQRAGSWPSAEALREHLDPIVQSIGRMPTRPELRDRGRFDLLFATHKFGGMAAVATALGYPYTPANVRHSIMLASRLASGRTFHSRLEKEASALLVSNGFSQHSVIREAHHFDFGNPERSLVVEINGCYWHDHRSIKETCPTPVRAVRTVGYTPRERDDFVRDLAIRHGLSLLELWECEKAQWPKQIQGWISNHDEENV